jgi:arginine decarboxylase
MTQWSCEQAKQVYSLSSWSNGYVDINTEGHLVMRPDGSPSTAIDLYRLVAELRQQKLRFPVLVRFPDILKHRIRHLCHAFDLARDQLGYTGQHLAVYPIKVNQQYTVVKEILQHGGARAGLEAGSKPELMAVLALSRPGGVIVCNGYKDREYIRLALLGQRLGQQVYIVVEKASELKLILQEANKLAIEPNIGVRIRLASIGQGKWQNSGGEKAKFGLSAGQVIKLVNDLQQEGQLHYLKLIHFHMGSQIANIHDLQQGLQEAARHFVELCQLGASLQVLDVGGGLAVDYDGTRSRNECSMNYSLEEYAFNVVRAMKHVCDEYQLPQPQIITESGRAMTAHHAMLITNVIEAEAIEAPLQLPVEEDDSECIHELDRVCSGAASMSLLEQYHGAIYWYEQAKSLYNLGALSLPQRARAEQLYLAICRKLQGSLQHSSRAQREVLDEINEKLADKYFCNFSVFQSLPDVWGIDQVFPIVPLHRLDEQPVRRGIIHDLTCDSDGHIEYYADNQGIEKTLPLHGMKEGDEYWLGMFLVGAYQEILGDMHNLFGDTDAINVRLDGNGGHSLEDAEAGDSVDELLRYVHFDTDDMLRSYRAKIDAAALSVEEQSAFLHDLEEGLRGYTYFENE